MYGHHIQIAGPFDQALERVQAALKAEGFGVLSDIDIQKAMREKLGKEMPAYRILEPVIHHWHTRRCRPTRRSGCSCRVTSP